MYKRQAVLVGPQTFKFRVFNDLGHAVVLSDADACAGAIDCLLYTSDAADERSSVALGGRRIIKKNTRSTQYTT